MSGDTNEVVKNLTPEALSARFDGNISVRTLANWRTQGKGPKFRRLGGVILYPLDEVEAWENANTYSSTSNYKAS